MFFLYFLIFMSVIVILFPVFMKIISLLFLFLIEYEEKKNGGVL